MGDKRKQALRVQFDGRLKLEFCGATITSDAGLLAFRELHEAFRLTELGSTVFGCGFVVTEADAGTVSSSVSEAAVESLAR